MRTLLLVSLLFFVAHGAARPWVPVPPVDLATLSPDDFADDDLDMPYLLHHFHTVANAVVEEGDDRGFIAISVWRRRGDNKPYNARIMENHLPFAWFYCTARPWNPYRGHPAVRARLEAILEFWTRMQHEDGRFSEYGPGRWNLAATAFATKFMGRTLELLADGPPIDPELHRRVIEANRRAILATLTNDRLLRHGRRYANQFSNVWAGAFAYLHHIDDPEIRELLHARLAESGNDFMSPVGYFYEANGPDWGYNMGTEHSNIRMSVHYVRGTPTEELFVEKLSRWNEWLSYNALPEADSRQWVLNHAIEARTSRRSMTTLSHFTPTDRVPVARVWAVTREQRAADRAERRKALAEQWPTVRDLPVGSFGAYTPYSFLHRDHPRPLPSEEERSEALKRIPHRSQRRFIHQRVDSRVAVQYTFVRRPAYYAAMATGARARERQRYGLGLVWTPEQGAFLQSQVGGGKTAWGTMAEGADTPYEAGPLEARFTVEGMAIEPQVGCRDLADGRLVVRWALGDGGEKQLTFADEHIEVAVSHPGRFTEHLPLLLAADPRIDGQSLKTGENILISFADAAASIEPTETRVVGKRLWIVAITAENSLNYRMEP